MRMLYALLLAIPAAAQSIHGGMGIQLPAPPPALAQEATGPTPAATADRFRWLEDGSSTETQAFVAAQNAYAARYLDQARKRVETLPEALDDLADLVSLSTMSVPIARGDALFYTRRLAGEPQPSIYIRRPGKTSKDPPAEKRLVDAAALSTDPDLTVRIEDVSRDGSLIAFSLVCQATGEASVRLFNASTGKLLEDQLPAGNYPSIAFAPDGSGIYYARRIRQGTLLFFHRIGTRSSLDTLVFGREFRGEELGPSDPFTARVSADGYYLVVAIDRGQPARHTDIVFRDLSKPAQPFEVLVWELDAHFSAQWFNGVWYVETDDHAPNGRILKADPGILPEAWDPLVTETANPIANWTLAGGKLLVTRVHDLKPETTLYSLVGKQQSAPPPESFGSLSPFSARPTDRFAYLSFQSPLVPPAVYRLDTVTGQTEAVYRPRTSVDPALYQFRQLSFTAKDGTQLPVLVVGRKNLQQDGSARLLMTPPAAFGALSTAVWSPLAAWWLAQGGWLALPSIRGAGLYSVEFRQGEPRDLRQQSFDDWFAAARVLIGSRFTTAAHLAMLGASSGDLLTAATLAQQPDLSAAIASSDPVFDFNRLPLPSGLSTPSALSPYQNLKPGPRFPAVLLYTSTASETDPLHARKTTALLQAASQSHRPILLHSAATASRSESRGLDRQIQDEQDRAAFLWVESTGKP